MPDQQPILKHDTGVQFAALMTATPRKEGAVVAVGVT